jgi:hypothetical protein
LADCDHRVIHTRFEIRAPIATMSATCNKIPIPPSLTTLAVLSQPRPPHNVNQITRLHNEEDD